MTGFPKNVRDIVTLRAGGACERCGLAAPAYQHHHRRPRGMGGSRAADTNGAANCVLLCHYCHDDVESRREWAFDFGFLVPQGKKPSEIPVWRTKKWVFLDDFGYVTPVEESR